MTDAPERIWIYRHADQYENPVEVEPMLGRDEDYTGYVRADRLEALEAENAVLRKERGELRMCVNCGRTAGVDHNRAMPLPDCASPDACTFDLTPNEAWQHWRKKAHNLRAENAALRDENERLRKRVKTANAEIKEAYFEGWNDFETPCSPMRSVEETWIESLAYRATEGQSND